jgi:hypothetical protein
MMFGTSPTLNIDITSDINMDISSAIKKENTYGVYFLGITTSPANFPICST